MILIDTNVISELMRPEPASVVLNWFDHQAADELVLSAITEAELHAGAAILPNGQRRARLVQAIEEMIEQDFFGRVLPFDSKAARTYAEIFANRRAAGQQIAQADCQIAAIARTAGAVIATRNVKDFEGCGIEIINPWDAE
ncbi:type II toxin-antitoxin system VapC family toxin [Paracoccus litorisediminis]|uniref:type II toxin-antitoxin system VapC family toxin n=1 Tax=Paracoccus litorisediminis TaxID=2006130 RepID=UPI00372FC04D